MTRVVEAAPGMSAAHTLGRSRPGAGDPASLRWSRFLPATEAEGPGRRAALWVQGCAVRCPGCFNPHLWADRGARTDDPHERAAVWVDEARAAGSTGITLLGGEPFDQADAVATVAEVFRAAGLSVMTFTGYELPTLDAWAAEPDRVARTGIRRLLDATDLLCDGPFLRAMPDARRPWIGSRNQGIHALTGRYAAEVRAIAVGEVADRIEVRIGADGIVAVNGWADDDALAALFDDLGTRVDRPVPIGVKEVAR